MSIRKFKNLCQSLLLKKYEYVLGMIDEFEEEICELDEYGRFPIGYLLDGISPHTQMTNFDKALELLKILLEKLKFFNFDFKKKDVSGHTLLTRAILTHKKEIILELISYSSMSKDSVFSSQISLNVYYPPHVLKYDALGFAMSEKLDITITELLVCDDTATIENLHGALHYAHSENIVRNILLRKPELLNQMFNDTRVLIEAVYKRNKDVVILLLKDFNADPNTVDGFGNTPLHLVADSNYIYESDLVEQLLKYGANPFLKNSGYVFESSPMKVAFRKQYRSLLKLFLKYYPDTPLELDTWSEDDALEFKKEIEESLIPDVKVAL